MRRTKLLDAFKAAGVKHVWWLTLWAAHHGYVTMNDNIEAAAKQHPELTVIDWNVYSRSHLDWFQSDGLHLLEDGASAMATLIHKTLLDDGVALKPTHIATSALPVAHRGRPYAAKLRATLGLAPYLRVHRKLTRMRLADGVHYTPAAGDLIAQKVLAQLRRFYDFR